MLEMFSAGFMQRAWLAGLIVAVICPLIGSFLVLRRQSMIMGGFNLSSILFGSLMTISASDLWVVAVLGLFACAFTAVFYRPLQYITFDEPSARVAGLPAGRLNVWLAVLTALTVALSMRIVGLLLVSAMMVIPVACALQTARSFAGTIIGGIIYGIITVTVGLTVSYYADLAPGGTIVLTGTALFILSCLKKGMVREEAAPPAECCHHHGVNGNEKG